MKILLSCVCAMFLGAAAFDQGDAAGKKDHQGLQGTWRVTKFVSAGKEEPLDLAKKITIIIEGDKVIFKLDADVISESTMKLDATKKPKHMDATRTSGSEKGQIRLGIYELNGDTLKIAGFDSDVALKKRPASFDDKSGPTTVMHLQRQKK
jgi:uncharacterized protein (TIGR03067 family)